MMRKQLELTTTAMEIEPEKFRSQYKVRKIFRVGGKLGSVGFPETTSF